jgi:DNA polymerase III subunit gamma/tau
MAGEVPSPSPSPGTAEPAASGPAAPLALYRRYRPATFAEVKGQEHVTEPLRQALRSGRVHHAYLFSGPRGCGKTSSARILARSLNCESGPTPDPCGICASCVALAPSGPGSIDVIEIDAASHGGVDDARDLRERAFYAPVSARYKIYIIDEAHMVTGGGFNALLKLVEEPPPHLKFVFATTEPEKVISTIRSRTHHYPFRLVPPAVLRELLEEILASEKVPYEPAVLSVVIRAGAGSVRDSLSVLDQLIAGSDESGLRYERAAALLGYADDSLLDEITDALAAGDGAAVFGAIDRVVEGGHDPRRFGADLLDRLRDLIIFAAVPDAATSGLLDVPADRLARMGEQAARFGQARLVGAAETVNAGLVEMRGATSPRLQLELICAQVLVPPPGSGERAMLARLERLEHRIDTSAADATGAEQAAAQASGLTGASRAGQAQDAGEAAGAGKPSGPPDAGVIRERWAAVLDAVRSRSRVAWVQLSNATVDSLVDGVLTLRFARDGEARAFSAREHDQDLGHVLEVMFGITPQIKAVFGATQGSAGPGQARARPSQANPRQRQPASGRAHGESGPPPEPAGPDQPAAAPGEALGEAGRDRGVPGRETSARAAPGRTATSQRQGGTTRAERAVPRGPDTARYPAPGSAQAAGTPDWPEAPDDVGVAADALTGTNLIERELGGRMIEESGEP